MSLRRSLNRSCGTGIDFDDKLVEVDRRLRTFKQFNSRFRTGRLDGAFKVDGSLLFWWWRKELKRHAEGGNDGGLVIKGIIV